MYIRGATAFGLGLSPLGRYIILLLYIIHTYVYTTVCNGLGRGVMCIYICATYMSIAHPVCVRCYCRVLLIFRPHLHGYIHMCCAYIIRMISIHIYIYIYCYTSCCFRIELKTIIIYFINILYCSVLLSMMISRM